MSYEPRPCPKCAGKPVVSVFHSFVDGFVRNVRCSECKFVARSKEWDHLTEFVSATETPGHRAGRTDDAGTSPDAVH
jgi:hypothetical protein